MESEGRHMNEGGSINNTYSSKMGHVTNGLTLAFNHLVWAKRRHRRRERQGECVSVGHVGTEQVKGKVDKKRDLQLFTLSKHLIRHGKVRGKKEQSRANKPRPGSADLMAKQDSGFSSYDIEKLCGLYTMMFILNIAGVNAWR